MSETSIQNPNTNTRSPNKAVVWGAAILSAAGLAVAANKLGALGNSDPFATNTPVPTESQPHQNYTVLPGDTESSIAAHFGHADDLDFENMLNKQLPADDQHTRNLQPGEKLRIPE